MTAIEYFNTALSDGWWNVWAWGFNINYKEQDYDAAVSWYRNMKYTPSHEDVLTKIMDMGGTILFKDLEGKMSKKLDKSGLEAGLKNVPSRVLDALEKDQYDADTTNEFLQCVLFDKMIFA